MPCSGNRWLLTALGVLGDGHTCRFHDPAGTDPASLRLFLCDELAIAGKEPLPNDQTGISISMPAHLTGGTPNQRCTNCIALLRMPALIITDDLRTTSGTVPARIAR